MNAHTTILTVTALVLVFGLLIAIFLMPHHSREHAGDGHGMKIVALVIGSLVLIGLIVLRNR